MNNLITNEELRGLCSDVLLNGNEFTTQHDNELRRMRTKLDGRLGKTSHDLDSEELRLLTSLCLNSKRHHSMCSRLMDLRKSRL